jgi:thymidine phosphorylase
VREGDHVEANQPLFEIYADDDEHLARGRDTLANAILIGDEPSEPAPIMLEKITK